MRYLESGMCVVFRLIVCLALLPTVVAADIQEVCEELWFARNAMLNEAGYCFTPPLGQSVFDNSDCTTRQPRIEDAVSAQISRIQQIEQNPPFLEEAGQSCQVDTSQTELRELRFVALRQQVTFHPATDGRTGGCVNYMGDDFLVFSAPDIGARILGRVESGFSFSLAHLPWRDWNFALVWRDTSLSDPITIGWYRQDLRESCALLAE